LDKVQNVGRGLNDWIRRNKRRILAVVIISGSTYVAYRIFRNRLDQTQHKLQGAEKTIANLSQSRMKSYFQTAQKGSDTTVISFVPQIRGKLEQFLEIPSTPQLRTSLKASTEEKLLIWEQMKNQAFTRTVVAIYAICLTTLFLRVEVNILGRYLFLDNTSSSENEEEEQPITQETQKNYLAYSEYIRMNGLKQLTNLITTKVTDELQNWPLQKMYTVEDVLNIFANIRLRIEGSPQEPERQTTNSFYPFLLPPEETQNATDKQLICLLNETRDVLESNHFENVLRICLTKSFGILQNHFLESFQKALETNTNMQKSQPNSLPMPKIIPLVKKQFDVITNISTEIPDQECFVQVISSLKELEEYSYYIFTSSYDEV